MPYKVYVDNNADLPRNYTEENGIHVLPVIVNLSDKEYFVTNDTTDKDNLDYKYFYEQMRAGARATTSQMTATFFYDVFEKDFQAGCDVLMVTISSALSGMYESVVVAEGMLKEKYPDRKLIAIDSLSASLGEGMLVHLVNEKVKAGATIEEAAEYAEQIKKKIHHLVTVEDLNYLKRGGRVSATSAFFGTMLQVKPIIHVDDEGRLVAFDKKQGRKRALLTLIEIMQKNIKLPYEYPVFLSNADCEEDAAFVIKQLKEKMGLDVMLTSMISPIVGAHAGPGTVALFYVSDEKR